MSVCKDESADDQILVFGVGAEPFFERDCKMVKRRWDIRRHGLRGSDVIQKPIFAS